MAFLIRNLFKLPFEKQFLNVYCFKGQKLQLKSLKTAASVVLMTNRHNPAKVQDGDSSKVAKKRNESIIITLMQNKNITITSLDDAKNLAKRRSMHLIKVQDMDTKTQRPVYKLLTATEMLENELSDIEKPDKNGAESASKKSPKTLNIGSRIAEHDLLSRVKNIAKWLDKQHEVRVLIQATSERDFASCEKVFKTIEDAVRTPQVIGKIVQKRSKGNMIKFSILPPTSDKTGSL